MYAWGSDTEGQLGNNSANDPQTKPIAVSLPSGVTATAIGASEYTGYALGSNGALYAWGLGLDGNLGNGTTTFSQTTPVAATLPAGVVPALLGSESQSETGYAIVRPATTLSQGSPTSATIIAPGAGYSGQLTVTNLPARGGSLIWTTTSSSSEVAVSSSGAVTVPSSVTTPGTVTMSGTVSDAIGDTGNWSFTLTVNGTPPTITSASSAVFTEGQAGGFTVTATGNPAPTFTGTGSLPIGVTLTSSGVLSGTPTQSGSFPITITAANGVLPNATQTFTLTVDGPPTITSANSTTFTQGQAGFFRVTATGTPSSTFTGTGSLPNGVTLTSSGVLSGTPTQSGSFPITITAANGGSPNATQTFTLTVDGPPTITSANSTAFTQGQAGGFTVTATGNPAPTFTGTGSLPIGVTLTSSGVLSGTPTQSGSFRVTITAANGVSPNATQTFTLTVDGPPTINSASSTTFTQGQAGSFTATATGYPVPTYSLTGAPTWLSIDPAAGTLSGTPPTGSGGTYAFIITAANGVSPNATQTFTLTVNASPTITSASSTTFTQGQAGSFTATATGYPVPIYSLTGAPTWLSIDPAAGTLSGTPPTGSGGTYAFTITAANLISPNATQTFTLTVDQAPSVTSANTTTFAEGMAGSFTATATGYPAPTFSETGALPNGVTLNGGGVLSGTPTQSGSFPITITATNTVLPDAMQDFTLTVTPSGIAPIITSANQSTFTQGQPGIFTVSAMGSPSPTFSETGTLPSGITLSSAGLLSGMTTQSGSFHFTIDATNGVSPDATQSFTLTVTQLFQIYTSSLSNATPGVAYGPMQLQEIGQAAGATLKWKKAGTLPKGLKVVGGYLEGTPSLKLAHNLNLSVPVQVTEKWVAISGRIKTKHSMTVTKILILHIN